MKYIQILVVVLFFFLFGACALFKGQDKLHQDQAYQEKDSIHDGIALTKDSISGELFEFTTMQAVFSGSYIDQTTQLPLKGVVRIDEGKFIWISIRPAMAIEASRILLTKDSIRILDRLNNYYYSESYRFIEDKFKLKTNYDIVESMLTGRIFFYPGEQSYKHYLKNEICDSCTEFSIQKMKSEEDPLLEHFMRFDSKTKLLKENNLYLAQTAQHIQLLYGEYVEQKGKHYYTELKIIGKNKSEHFYLTCTLENFIFDSPLSAPFKVPENYTRNKAR